MSKNADKEPANEPLKKTTLRLTNDILLSAKLYAAKEGLTLNKYILAALISAIFSSKRYLKKKKVGKIKKKEKNNLDVYIRR